MDSVYRKIISLLIVLLFGLTGCHTKLEFDGYKEIRKNIFISDKLLDKEYFDVATVAEIDYMKEQIALCYFVGPSNDRLDNYFYNFVDNILNQNTFLYLIEFDSNKTYYACSYFEESSNFPTYEEMLSKEMIWFFYSNKSEIMENIGNIPLQNTFKVTYGDVTGEMLSSSSVTTTFKQYILTDETFDYKTLYSHQEQIKEVIVRTNSGDWFDQLNYKNYILTDEQDVLYIIVPGLWGEEHYYKSFDEYAQREFGQYYESLKNVFIVDENKQCLMIELQEFIDFIKSKGI